MCVQLKSDLEKTLKTPFLIFYSPLALPRPSTPLPFVPLERSGGWGWGPHNLSHSPVYEGKSDKVHSYRDSTLRLEFLVPFDGYLEPPVFFFPQSP